MCVILRALEDAAEGIRMEVITLEPRQHPLG